MFIIRTFTFLLALSAAITASSEENLLTNAGFEEGLSGWKTHIGGDAQAVWSISKKEHSAGKASLQVSNLTAISPHVFGTIFQAVAVKPDTTYRLSLRVKATNAKGIWFGGGPQWLLRMACPTGTYDWRSVEIIYKTLADEREFEFRINSDDVVENACFDDVRMVEVK